MTKKQLKQEIKLMKTCMIVETGKTKAKQTTLRIII